MKADVTNVCSKPQRNAEGLNRAVQVLIVQSVFIVPDSGTWVCDFAAHEPDAIVSWVRLNLVQRGAGDGPCRNGRPHPHCRTNSGKGVVVPAAAYAELVVGCVVKHVAFRGVLLAP